MGYDIDAATVAVLESGLGEVPTDLPKDGSTVPVASAVWEPFGAVQFVRRWRDGQWDCDTAITVRRADGSWEEPVGYGGCVWLDTGLERPAGEGVIWLESSGTTLPWPDGSHRPVAAHQGMASREVSALEIRQGGATRIEPIASPIGAVLVLGDWALPIDVAALNEAGEALQRDELPGDLDLDWPDLDDEEPERPVTRQVPDVVGEEVRHAIGTLVRAGFVV